MRRLLPVLLLAACQDPLGKTGSDSDVLLDSSLETADTSKETGDTSTDTGIPDAVFDPIRDAVQRDIRSAAASGASVAIWKDGALVFAEGFGTLGRDSDVPVSPDTLFQIGSDTKKITAIAVLRQVEAGTLSLDDTLESALPDLVFALDPETGRTRTIRHLLTHTSGLFDYTPWSDAPDDASLHDIATGHFAENEYAMNPAGEFWNYANPNFALAGLVAETADGRYWADIVEDDIFGPLGMTRTFARAADAVAAGNAADGYGIIWSGDYDIFDPLAPYAGTFEYTVGSIAPEDQPDNAFSRPAGLVWSTAPDMVRLGAFLMEGNDAVLDAASLATLTAPAVPLYEMAPDFGSYGMGLFLYSGFNLPSGYHEVPLWSHGGATPSMSSAFYLVPSQDIAISILSNGYHDDFRGTAAAALEAVVSLPEPSEAPAFPPPDDPANYNGTWFDPHGVGTITLASNGSSLDVSAPDIEAAGVAIGDQAEVTYQDYLSLTLARTPLYLQVLDGDDGTVHQYLVDRGFVLTRPDGEVTATNLHAAPDPARILRDRLLDPERFPLIRP